MTIYDYICHRWPNHAQRIIECMYQQDKLGARGDLCRQVRPEATHVLDGLFVWGGTSEGVEYWRTLARWGETKAWEG